MIFCPVVRVITVSGVDSICSIKSLLITTEVWLRRVTAIMCELSKSTSVDGVGIYSELPNRLDGLSLENTGNSSEEIVKMALMLVKRAPLPAVHIAEALLHSWIRGDLTKLERELHRTAHSPLEATDDEEKERLQLLKSIAVRMKTRTNLFAARATDPVLDLCVDLLAHLSIQRDYQDWPRVPGRTRKPI
jgi:hypothetical protein